MNTRITGVIVFLLVCSCIGWSSEQKEVVDSYNSLLKNSEEENWHRLSGGLSEDTRMLIEELAVIYTEAGVPFDNDGDELLASIVSDTDLLSFSETVVSVEFRNDNAYLISGEGSRAASYQFVEESGSWKLNLVPLINELIVEVLRGTPETEGPIAEQVTYISTGEGTCEFALRNDLENLSIWSVFCSPSSSDSWGVDWLGASILGSGAEMGIWLEPGVYDIQLTDSDENTYTIWQIELTDEGVFWPVTAQDRDVQN